MNIDRLRLIKLPSRKERIYILPTRFGGVFLTGACVMLLVGATYQNNLVNLLAFFMFSLVFVAMVQTHNNLKDVKVDSVDLGTGFAGGEFVVSAMLKNISSQPHFNLETHVRTLTLNSTYENQAPLLPMSGLKVRSSYRCPARGKHLLKKVCVSSVFPLGLFYAWCWFETNTSYLIFPEPKGGRALPNQDHGNEEAALSRSCAGGDDFHGHRRFTPGDSPRHVDWKARARGRPLMVKEFNEGAATSVLFDWFALDGLETEARLSQLARWVDEAAKRGLYFSMRMPQKYFPPGSGTAHAQRCLEYLALFSEADLEVSEIKTTLASTDGRSA